MSATKVSDRSYCKDKRPLNHNHRQNYYDTIAVINQSFSWDLIFSKLGLKPPRRGRAQCALHGGDSPLSMSLTEERGGLFNCFVCGAKGNKISFVMQTLNCDFKTALSFFGLRSGRLPVIKPDPEQLKRNHIRQNLENWRRKTLHKIGLTIFRFNQAQTDAERRLEAGADDCNVWLALRLCHEWKPRLEAAHDLLLSRHDSDWIEAFRREGAYASHN